MTDEMRNKLIRLLSGKSIDTAEDVEAVADHLITHGVTVQDVSDTNVGEWISVKDRLPEESGVYLCFTRLGNFMCLSFSAKHNAFNVEDYQSEKYADFYEIDCSHWRPLPQPPKGE